LQCKTRKKGRSLQTLTAFLLRVAVVGPLPSITVRIFFLLFPAAVVRVRVVLMLVLVLLALVRMVLRLVVLTRAMSPATGGRQTMALATNRPLQWYLCQT
jgi:hypothetical protein